MGCAGCVRFPFGDAIDLQADLRTSREAIAMARRVERRLQRTPAERHAVARLDRGDDALQVAADLAAQEG